MDHGGHTRRGAATLRRSGRLGRVAAFRLRVLVAEDQPREVSEACDSLRAQGHEVATAFSHAEAMRLADTQCFDAAIVDLGWYTDLAYVERCGQEQAANAGWEIDDALIRRSPDAVRILYTTRTKDRDGTSIVAAAAERGMLLVKKYDSGSQQHLAAVATFVAQQVTSARAGRDAVTRSGAVWRGLMVVAVVMTLVLVATVAIWLLTDSVTAAAVLVSIGCAAALGLAALVLTATRDLQAADAAPFLATMRDVLTITKPR